MLKFSKCCYSPLIHFPNILDFCIGWYQMSPQTSDVNLILTELIATNMYKIALICSSILFTNLCTHALTQTHTHSSCLMLLKQSRDHFKHPTFLVYLQINEYTKRFKY